MKTTLTLLLLCFCTTLFAQENAKDEEASSSDYFSWFAKQEERKKEFLREKIDSLSLFDLRNRSKDDKKLVVILNMPIYEGPKGLSLMPELPIDTTTTYYLKIYPVKED
ncbi:hypothetical protein [uncultured Dokdonia sp.]|uniref:hypothetical protein n=1 Tax=uncultured Dokdonia sp. TaxID=575653 RepID=UPI00262741B3|nr:hypothetical protein [uncultured Dokdonia sp.]